MREQPSTASKAQLRGDLERTRDEFRSLVQSLSEADLKRKRPGSPWSVGSLLAHLVASMEILPREFSAARKGRNFMALPPWLFNPIRMGTARLLTTGQTRAKLVRRYDAACTRVLQALDTVREDEWQRGGHFYDEGYWTVQTIFETQPRHFQEHAAEIRRIIGGTSKAQAPSRSN